MRSNLWGHGAKGDPVPQRQIQPVALQPFIFIRHGLTGALLFKEDCRLVIVKSVKSHFMKILADNVLVFAFPPLEHEVMLEEALSSVQAGSLANLFCFSSEMWNHRLAVSRIQIKNCLSIEYFEATMGPEATTLVGPNGCGKSNVFRVLGLILKAISGFDVTVSKSWFLDPSSSLEVRLQLQGCQLIVYPILKNWLEWTFLVRCSSYDDFLRKYGSQVSEEQALKVALESSVQGFEFFSRDLETGIIDDFISRTVQNILQDIDFDSICVSATCSVNGILSFDLHVKDFEVQASTNWDACVASLEEQKRKLLVRQEDSFSLNAIGSRCMFSLLPLLGRSCALVTQDTGHFELVNSLLMFQTTDFQKRVSLMVNIGQNGFDAVNLTSGMFSLVSVLNAIQSETFLDKLNQMLKIFDWKICSDIGSELRLMSLSRQKSYDFEFSSGAEMQSLCVFAAFTMNKKNIWLDEPLTGWDPAMLWRFRSEFLSEHNPIGKSRKILIATHSAPLVDCLGLGTQIIHLNRGPDGKTVHQNISKLRRSVIDGFLEPVGKAVLFSSACIFCEGEQDEQFFSCMRQLGIPFVGSFTVFKIAKKQGKGKHELECATFLQVPRLVIIDGDYVDGISRKANNKINYVVLLR
jgi:energy-coupling factor transporter ATP-binding protein EcfA2